MKLPEKKEWNQLTGREGKIKNDSRNETIDEVRKMNPPRKEISLEELEKIITLSFLEANSTRDFLPAGRLKPHHREVFHEQAKAIKAHIESEW